MNSLKLWLFGSPRLEYNGLPVDIGRRKALALLVYLAVTQQRHSRNALAVLFWPEVDGSHARGTLRRVLSDLNKLLGEAWLETEGETIALQAGLELWLDIEAFHALLVECQTSEVGDNERDAACLAALTEAVNLYRDDFLAGFTLPDSPAFDEWQFFQTEGLRRDLAGALERLVHYHSVEALFERAISYARRWLTLDPLQEAPHRALMELYAWTEQRNAALRQYQECVRILDEELAVPPSVETTELFERIRRGEVKARSRQAAELETNLPASNLSILQAPQLSTETESELRLVTVLVAGLSGSPDSAWEAQPEDLAEAIHTLQYLAAEIAPRYEARLENLGADRLQLIFGIPQIHEDDPRRAIQAGLDLQQAAGQHGLKVSSGLSTGHVYFSPLKVAGTQEVAAIGPVVNLAARLQHGADTGQVLVSSATYSHLRRAFSFNPLPIKLDHRTEAVTVYEVGHLLPHSDKAHSLEGWQPELIGREEELGRLKAALEAMQQGHGQVVTLSGEAGLGKSRLVAELKQVTTSGMLWLEGRCLEFRRATSYWPFIDLFQGYLAADAEDEPDQAAYLDSVLADLVRRDVLSATRAEEMADLLGFLLSFRIDPIGAKRLQCATPDQIKHQTFGAIYDFIEALARQQPLVLVFEDVHWADDLSLDLFTLLLEIIPSQPLLLLYIFRPEPHSKVQRLARLAAQKYQAHYTDLQLRELAPSLGRRLVEGLLGAGGLPDTVEELILEKARGNPFFFEETIRALIDSGAIRRVANQWQVQSAVEALVVPERIQSVILSRTDRLEPRLKQTLQAAAVMGRLFRPQIIAPILPPDLDLESALLTLEELALIYQERVVPEVEYSFKHVLVQETIYQNLSRQRRSWLHQRLAETIEQQHAADLWTYVEQLAYHYDHSPAAGKAAQYLLKAGQKSLAAYLNDQAIAYLQKAWKWLEARPGSDPSPETERIEWQLAILTSLGQLHHGLGQDREAEQYLRQALVLGQAAGIATRELVRLYYWLGEAVHWQGRYAEQINLGEAAAALLSEHEDESLEAVLVNQTIAIGHYNQSHYDLFHALTDRTAQFIQHLPYTAELRPAYFHIIIGFQQQKAMTTALQWIEHLERLASEHYDLRALAEAQDFRIGISLEMGYLQDPGLDYAYSLKLFNKIGDNSRYWRSLGMLVWHSLISGRLEEAAQYVVQELEVAERVTFALARAETLFDLGVVRLNQHAWAEAEAALIEVEQLASAQPTSWLKCQTAYVLGRLYLAQHQRSAALSQFQTALTSFELIAKKEWQFRWWPFLVGILSGLESAADTPAEFAAFCRDLPEAKRQQLTALLPGPWFLEPATVALLSAPDFEDIFTEELASGWTWQDPFADCSFTVRNGLEIQAVNGRDLWQVNYSAPRLLRPVVGDFILQTICTPPGDDRDQPVIGGLLLWHDPDNFLRLVWGNRGPRDLSFEGCLAGRDMTIGRGRLLAPEGQERRQTFLRLERQNHQVRALASADGDQWYHLGQVMLSGSDPIQAGIHAVGWIDRTIYPGVYVEGTAIRFDSVQIWSMPSPGQ